MPESTLLPRVLVTRDGKESVQLTTSLHNPTDRSAYLSFRRSIDSAERRVVIRTGEGIDLASMGRNVSLPVLDSSFLSVCSWFVWDEFDEAHSEGEHWYPGDTDTHFLEPSDLVRRFRKRAKSELAPDEIIESLVVHSARFGIAAIVDRFQAFLVGYTFEQLRRSVMDRADIAWRVNEDRQGSRLELDATSGFRASRGLLSAHDLADQLRAPRYAGVREYWLKAIALRAAVPPDPSGVIANAAHAVEALARLLVGDSANTAGAALSSLAANGRIPQEVATLARQIHGRTSGDLGARHGDPSGPTDSALIADYYFDLFAATTRQLLAADT